MKLISMIDFVLWRTEDLEYADSSIYISRLDEIENYAKFLKQPLKLEMFAQRVGDEYNVLFDGFKYTESQKYSMENKIAKSIHDYGKDRFYITIKKPKSWHSYFQIFTIEDLIQCDLTMTKKATENLFL